MRRHQGLLWLSGIAITLLAAIFWARDRRSGPSEILHQAVDTEQQSLQATKQRAANKTADRARASETKTRKKETTKSPVAKAAESAFESPNPSSSQGGTLLHEDQTKTKGQDSPKQKIGEQTASVQGITIDAPLPGSVLVAERGPRGEIRMRHRAAKLSKNAKGGLVIKFQNESQSNAPTP